MNSYSMAKGALVAAFVVTLAACDQGLVEINDNPNAPTDVGGQFLLPQSMRSTVQAAFGAGQMLSHTAIWPQQGVELQYPDEEEGNVRDSRMQGYWDGYYAGPLADIQTVIDKGVELGLVNHEGVGRIWKSYVFHIVTDSWGDVPYSEALQAGAENAITQPAYDAQQAIYAGMIADLTTGAGLLNSGAQGFGSGDLLYGDDMDLWRRFANSLRMRLAMRMSEVDPAGAQAAFVAAWNAGGFASNADNAMFGWSANPYENPIFRNWQGRDDHGVSATMIDTLASLNDPRIELYAELAQDGVYRGLNNGNITPPLSIALYSRIGNLWREFGAATPTALMTYSEVLLLGAEAAERGWIPDNPATLYAAGITANLSQWDAFRGHDNLPAAPTDAEITAYLAEPAVVYNAATGREQIQLQQWIGLYMGGPEAWANWRRTDIPALVAGPDLLLSRIPVRFTYPSLEQSLNQTSRDAAVARQGSDELVTRVWWDVF